ncbi:hypothetical protein DPMN_132185 [Dreissena polymorpha]|uniref:Uncharacterized protein n=1 Tax=Dreissena polymorpha TaxID=45954 RepID=A0A9D4JCW6_DREPO|nr:hypothetical protein DPMN_132185 [Dreissena polymorpha]
MKCDLYSIIRTNLLIQFHEDRTRNVASKPNKENCLPTGGHVFQWTGTTFELNQHIIKTNILTNFELDRDIIGTKLLTKFHEDRTRNVASRVFTRKTAPPTCGHVASSVYQTVKNEQACGLSKRS